MGEVGGNLRILQGSFSPFWLVVGREICHEVSAPPSAVGKVLSRHLWLSAPLGPSLTSRNLFAQGHAFPRVTFIWPSAGHSDGQLLLKSSHLLAKTLLGLHHCSASALAQFFFLSLPFSGFNDHFLYALLHLSVCFC